MSCNVYFTSFFKSKYLPDGVEPLSAAVYQPKGFSFPKVAWTDIREQGGAWIRPREFVGVSLKNPEGIDPALVYRDYLLKHYYSRLEAAERWADSLTHDVALCCWCPRDRAAQRQLKEFGSYICHTAVLSEFCHNELGLTVWEDGDRRQMAVLTQRAVN